MSRLRKLFAILCWSAKCSDQTSHLRQKPKSYKIDTFCKFMLQKSFCNLLSHSELLTVSQVPRFVILLKNIIWNPEEMKTKGLIVPKITESVWLAISKSWPLPVCKTYPLTFGVCLGAAGACLFCLVFSCCWVFFKTVVLGWPSIIGLSGNFIKSKRPCSSLPCQAID